MTKLFVSILTLALLSSVAPTFAGSTVQPDPVVTNVVAPTATQLVEKFGDKLDQYITALASKAGVAADHFYPIFVKQQRITGIFEMFLMTVGAFVGVFFLRAGYFSMRDTIDTDDEGENRLSMRDTIDTDDEGENRHNAYKKREDAVNRTIFNYVVGAIFSIVASVAILAIGNDSVGKAFNPEFSAVQSLVQMVK